MDLVSYSLDGKLAGVPMYKQALRRRARAIAMGLIEVASW